MFIYNAQFSGMNIKLLRRFPIILTLAKQLSIFYNNKEEVSRTYPFLCTLEKVHMAISEEKILTR